jgi:hypothetical protein
MENATFTAADIAEIEAEAHALRAEATFNMAKTVVTWVRRQFTFSTPSSTQNA